MFLTLSLCLFCILAQRFFLSLHRGLPYFLSWFVLASCTSLFCMFLAMSSASVLPRLSTFPAIEVPDLRRTSPSDSHEAAHKTVEKNASRTMKIEVENATSACKILHVLYTPAVAFCKPLPWFFSLNMQNWPQNTCFCQVMSMPHPALERFAPIADYSNTISRATLCRNEKQCLLPQTSRTTSQQALPFRPSWQ